MQKEQLKKTVLNKIYLLLGISLLAGISSIFFAINAFAATVPVEATRDSSDCFWAEGEGTELYVPDGSTCVLTGTPTATEITGYTTYAVVVYPGGTLIIGDNTVDTTFTVDGNILNMGTIYVGDGTSHAYDSVIKIINNEDLVVYDPSGGNALFQVRANAGTGYNNVEISGTVMIGYGTDALHTPDHTSTFTLSDNSTSTTGRFANYAQTNVNAGTLISSNLDARKPDLSGSISNFTVASGATFLVDSYYNDGGSNFALTVGTYGWDGRANMNVAGTVTVPLYGLENVNVVVGSATGYGYLFVDDTGTFTVSETNTFLSPPNGSPSNSFTVKSAAPYGLDVEGDLSTAMFLLNSGGYVAADNGGTGGASITATNHYKQESSLYVAAGDTMTITGTADIDGDVQIDGTLDVSDCTKAMNDGTESFDISATGVFDTGDGSCSLTDAGASDGLNIQGTDTDLNITNGATVTITGDVTVDNYGKLDANGYFAATEDLIVKDAATVTLNDTDGGDDFEVDNLAIEPNATLNEAALTVEASSVLALKVGNVDVGHSAATANCILNVYGTLNSPSGTAANFAIDENGIVNAQAGGTINFNSDDPGLFRVYGGALNVDGTLNLASTELQLENGPTDAGSIEVSSTGLINSTATPASDRGFDYIMGNLLIENGSSGTTNGAMKFDDKIYIATSNNAVIAGYLEGTDLIYHNGTGSIAIAPAGEMKVIGTGTPLIDIYRDLQLYGKLNADDGDGGVTINNNFANAVVGGGGSAGIDSYAYILTGDLIVDSGASIDVSNFFNSYAPSGSPTYGGSYGGQGGKSGGTDTFGETKYFTKPNYDTSVANPVGMFGFTSAGATHKYGGGAIYIEAKRTLSIDGAIRANGESTSTTAAGAGSGGLIVIDHNITHADTSYEFKGAGTIEANGGDATGGSDSYGGGGGRIIIKSILFEEPDDTETGAPHYAFTGPIRARGGVVNNGSTYAAAGTIVYLGDDNSPNDTLIVNQESRTLNSNVITKVRDDLYATDIFDRIEARNGASLKYTTGPAMAPISCFESGTGSSVDLISMACTANPDKPDTLHVNNSYAGAQTGSEPWFNSPVTVGDLTPEFSIVARNAESTTSHNKVRVQISQDPAKFDNPANYRTCATCTWDADVTLDSSVTTGNRSVDFEYAGPALTPGTYYIRVAYYDTAGTNLGLWTHRDMGNHYSFTISSTYFDISNDCSDLIEIRDVLAAGRAVGNGLKYSNGDRYGYGSCGFTINSTSTAWKVLYGMAPLVTEFKDSGSTYTISPIDNGVGDCTIDVSGNKSIAAEEEYGYNIADVSGTSAYVQTDSECSQDYDSWNSGTGNYVFDIETNALKDKILQNLAGTITNGQFDLFTYATVDGSTPANTYNLDTWMVITTAP